MLVRLSPIVVVLAIAGHPLLAQYCHPQPLGPGTSISTPTIVGGVPWTPANAVNLAK